MKLTRVLFGVTVAATMSAGALRADFKDFSTRCSSGAMRACASLQLTTTLNGLGGTSVRILVRNLQGWTNGYGDNTGGSLISRIGIVTPPITGYSGGLNVVATSGAGSVGVNPAGNWQLRSPGGLGGQIELTAGIFQGNSGIAGCSAPNNGYPSAYFSTCDGGWVEFTFTTTNEWSANNAEVGWLTGAFNTPAGAGIECTSDPLDATPRGRSFCDNVVTPEPVTMVLLGSGLAGMSGFGFMRRRRKEDNTEV